MEAQKQTDQAQVNNAHGATVASAAPADGNDVRSGGAGVRTVTYVAPPTNSLADGASTQAQYQANTTDAAQLSSQAQALAQPQPPTSSRTSAQFQPMHQCQTAWQFWYYQRQTPFYTQQQQQTIDGITRVGPQPKPERASSRGPPESKESYRDQLKPLGKIPTLEHFFNYYVHMKKPTEMPREIDIHFFRDNLVPMWEDSPEGGIVILKIKKDDNIDKMWESILFAMVGEQFEEPKVIGASLSLRTKERLLQVWLSDGRNDRVRTNVSNKIRHFLSLDPANVTLYYKEHIKSIKDGSTMKNAEGFKFMKAGQRQNQQPRNQQFFSNSSSQRGSNHGVGGDLSGMNNSGRRHYQPGRPSFDSSSNNAAAAAGGSNSARKLQPWSGLGAAANDSYQQASGATNSGRYKGGRRPSDHPQHQHQQKPFSHLGASAGGADANTHGGQRVYRPKAGSHV